MSSEWKKITLLSFSSSAKILMNGFFHGICGLKRLLIKHVLRIISLFKRTNDIKTAFYDKLFDQFLNLNIKISYVCKGKNNDYNFILQDLNKNKIVKLLKCAMGSNKVKVNKNICKYEKIDEKRY